MNAVPDEKQDSIQQDRTDSGRLKQRIRFYSQMSGI
jgi:hypothetical protein